MNHAFQRVLLSGSSMNPKLQDGMLLEFSFKDKPKIGDICLIKDLQSSELIIHRLISENPRVFKGDNSLNLEREPEFTFVGVCLEQRGKLNHLIALLSRYYRFETPWVFRVLVKIAIRIISF